MSAEALACAVGGVGGTDAGICTVGASTGAADVVGPRVKNTVAVTAATSTATRRPAVRLSKSNPLTPPAKRVRIRQGIGDVDLWKGRGHDPQPWDLSPYTTSLKIVNGQTTDEEGLPTTPLTPLPGLALLLLMSTGYALLSHFGERLISIEGISMFWPASGFAAVMMLWAQTPRRRLIVVLGVVLGTALNAVWRGGVLPNELGYLLGNLVEPLIMVPFLVKGTSASQRLDRSASLGWLLAGSTAAVSTAATIVALLGVWSFDGTGDPSDFAAIWISLALGDLIGLLVVVPLMLQAVPISHLWSLGSVRQQTALWALLVVTAVASSLTQGWVLAFLVVLVFMALMLDSSASSVGLLFFVAVVLWLWQNGAWQPRPVQGGMDPRLVLVGVVVLVQAIALSTSQRRRAMTGQQVALEQMHGARETLTAVLEAAPTGIAMYRAEPASTGATFHMTYMNGHGLRQGAVDPSWVEQEHTLTPGLTGEVQADLYNAMVRAWSQQQPQDLVIDNTTSDSHWSGIHAVSVSPVPDDRLVVVWKDITAIALARNEAEENWTLLRRALDSGLDAFFILEHHEDDWRIVFVNRAGAAHVGDTAERLVGRRLRKVLPFDIQPLVCDVIDTAVRRGSPQNALVDLRTFEHAWRGEFDLMVTPAGHSRVVLTLRDVSEVQTTRRALEAARTEAVEASRRDPLTGLPNRTVLTERLQAALDDTANTGDLVAVAFLDIDAFKAINDLYGHAVGDEVLVTLAGQLRTSTRRHDLAVRLGGDEFVVVFTGISQRWSSDQFERRLAAALSLEVVAGDTTLTVTASAGLAVGDAELAQHVLLQRADAAMYVSKASRQGRLVAYQPDMNLPEKPRL